MKTQATVWGGIVGLVVWAIITSPTLADDLIQPPWRGTEGTTYQQWTFDDDDDPAIPEIWNNPYGTASADLDPHPLGAGWAEETFGRNGVWRDLTGVTIDIDNREDPLDYKDIWIQITYLLNPGGVPAVHVPGALQLPDGQTIELEPAGLGAWYLQQSMWRIEPNPDHEVIQITGTPGLVIDQIVVDTICTPEPATLSLFALGAAGLFIRRRR